MLVRRAEDLVDDVRREVVRDHDLHEEAGPDEEEGTGGVHVARVAWRGHLRDELARPHDRSGDEVREEREVRRERPDADGREVAAVDVDDVRDPHEREEGDPDRQEDRARLEREVEPDEREEVVRRRDEEVVVLEVAEQTEIPDERDDQELLSRALRGPGVDRGREDLVPHDREREQEAESPVPARVEDEARGDDERPPALRSRLEEPRQRQHDHEEDREGGGREEHASRTAAGAVRCCYSGCGGGRRVAVRSLDVTSSAVSSPTTSNHEGSSGSPGCTLVAPYTSARSRVALRAAAHSASATRSQATTMTPAITGRVETRDGGERRDPDEEEDLQQEPRHGQAARPRRVDGPDPARALADDGAALVPSGLLPVVGGQDALAPERMELGLEAADLGGEGADGAENLVGVLAYGLA